MKVSQQDRVLRLTLDRPERRNALNEDTCRELVDALERAWQDPSVGCVLLDAEGEIFCAGMDLDEATSADAAARTALHEQAFTFLWRATKPVVSAVQGGAFGGGIGLLANSHIVLAAQGCKFGLTEIRLGMWPFVIWRAMTQAIGERRTIELALSGRIFGTPDALQFGVVHEVVPPFELEDRAETVAHAISQASPFAIGLGMRYLKDARGLDAEASGRLARDLRAQIFAGADFHEGVSAFRERRAPQWPSRTRPAAGHAE